MFDKAGSDLSVFWAPRARRPIEWASVGGSAYDERRLRGGKVSAVTVRVPVRPSLLKWAARRARWTGDDLAHRFPRYEEWVAGDVLPTMKQLQSFASAMHVPLGYLFLPEPPAEETPIPDFRTRNNRPIDDLSVDLRDTIYLCQRRQDWFRDFATSHGFRRVGFVGSATVGDAPHSVADEMRQTISFTMEKRRTFTSWEDAFRRLIDLIEAAGVLVSVNGVVGGDNRRVLDPQEFGGFTLVDSYAPLIFVNAADTKAAQIFTIIHELAHVWLGESAISDAGVARASQNAHERWCNHVAAEVLVPRAQLLGEFRGSVTVEELERLTRVYRVSTLVVLLRLYELGAIPSEDFPELYAEESERVRELAQRRQENGGGNYYYTQPIRLGRRFAQAVIKDAHEGGTAYGEAYRLLGTARPETFNRLADELGVA